MKKSENWIKILFVVLIIGTFAVIVNGNYFGKKISIEIGQIAPETIYAPFKIENEVATERKRVAMEKLVEQIYTLDYSVQEQARANVTQLINYTLATKEVMKDRSEETPSSITNANFYDIDEKVEFNPVETLQSNSPILLYPDQYTILLAATKEELLTLEDQMISVLEALFDKGIHPDENKSLEIRQLMDEMNINMTHQKVAYEIISSQIKANIIIDEEATKEAQKVAREQVEPVYVLQEEIIIGQGTRVTEETYLLLQKAGYLDNDSQSKYTQYLGVGILLIIIILFLYRYISSGETFHDFEVRQYGLVSVIYILSIAMIYILKNVSFVFIPLSVGPMLLAILMKKDIAILFELVLIILAAVIHKGDILFVIYLLLTGIISVLVVATMQQRKQTMRSALMVGLMHALIYSSLKLLVGAPLSSLVIFESIQAFSIGLISVVLVVGSLPLWEAGFGFITPMQLLELTNPNQPILKRLLLEATGTYYHSLLVANLAETAADEIGANALMARVGGYYHDIGKLTCSNYFKENQVRDNPHDYLEPRSSSNIIISHVTSGIDLANEYKLPQCVKDMIIQHHGTSIMQFFYIKAKETEEAEVKIEDFRYPGPKPMTKEAALVMLADVVEATVRSMQHKIGDGMTVEEIVRKMVKQKLEEGQLDNCPLYISDIDKIISSFTRMLKGMYHERIEYPEKKG